MNKKQLAVSIFLVFTLLVLGVGIFWIWPKEKKITEPQKELLKENRSTVLAEKSFGDLKKIIIQNNSNDGLSRVNSQKMLNSNLPSGRGGLAHEETMIYPPLPINGDYQLVYVGKDFVLPEGMIEVLKRKKGRAAEGSSLWKNSLENFEKMTQLELTSFEKLRVANVNFYEDKDFGLNFSLDLENSSVYIGVQWNKWKDPTQLCEGDQECIEKNRLTEKDWLKEEEFLIIAENFLDKIGLDRSNYEKGFLEKQNYWLVEQKNIPEVAVIFYQQKIADKKVFDLAGNPDGLRVEIDVRQKKVRGVSPIYNWDFFSSAYPAESDRARIIEIAENGGWKGEEERLLVGTVKMSADQGDEYQKPKYPFEKEKKKREVKLTTPILGMVKVWNYLEEQGESEELYVPAFIFPIIGEKENFWPKNIIVPAVQEK